MAMGTLMDTVMGIMMMIRNNASSFIIKDTFV